MTSFSGYQNILIWELESTLFGHSESSDYKDNHLITINL